MSRYGLQRLVTIQVLATSREPNFHRSEIDRHFRTSSKWAGEKGKLAADERR
jgi:ribosomal protein L32E